MKKILICLLIAILATITFTNVKIANAQVIDDDEVNITNFLSGKKFNIDIEYIDYLIFYSNMTNGSGEKFATLTMYSSNPYESGPYTYDVYVGTTDSYIISYTGGGFLTYTTYLGGGAFSTNSINLTGDKTLTIEFSPNLTNFDVVYENTLDNLVQVLNLYTDTSFQDALNQILENPNYYGLYTQEQLDQEKYTAKQLGYQEGLEDQDSLYNMILAVVDTPFRVFDNIFDFDVLGVNIKNIVMSFATIAIVIFVIKRFI